MGESANQMAAQFEQANAEIISLVESLSDEEWRATTEGENWPVAVVAHHVAVGHTGIADWVVKVAQGLEVKTPITKIHEINAQHASNYSDVTREVTLELLKSNGAVAASAVRSLSDEQLDNTAVMRERQVTTRQVIEQVLIGHVRGHLKSIQTAIGRS